MTIIPCGPIATFNFNSWIASYPAFACLTPEQGAVYWSLASIFHRNDGFGPVKDATLQQTLMNLMTAHVAQLFCPKGADGQPAAQGAVSTLTGRIKDASEGSVSASTELASTIGIEQAWFFQTQYGITYWQATAAYRTMRYIPGPERVFSYPIGNRFGPGYIP